ncbi:MAG TPA: zf-HC2 domain-containing protein [Ktedonobacteraceae bacterium]|nr:zf-HC2 domain-containing protein [Ktedonobacteraceae bacterium]
MTQQEHLTTEQLSAFLDKQLTPQEQAFFDAHIQSCQRCQNALAELRRTVVLLHAMPQPQLPRSFTLPASAGVSRTSQAARPQPQPVRQGRILNYTLRRSVRAVSTLAAAVAVIFILSGLLANVHFAGGGASTSAGSTFNASSGPVHPPATVEPNATGGAQTQGSTPKAAGSPIMGNHQSGTPKASSATTPTPTSTPTQGASNSTGATEPPTLPPALDPGQPAGRLTLGALLLLLSIAGLVATRRRRRNTAS